MKRMLFKPTTLCCLAVTLISMMPLCALADSEAPIALALHAGAGTIKRQDMAEGEEASIMAALEQALEAGYAVLHAGGSSLDAVTRTVTLLEDSPHFNAGRGAVFNADGKNELDASIMEGRRRNAGAVAAVHNIRNPILLARQVMENSRHVMLMGAGAETFAREQGLKFEDKDYFFTERRWQQLQKAKDKEQAKERAKEQDQNARIEPTELQRWFSTVGAVALDQNGDLAAATSTGGMTNKRWGRVGDSPVIGAGTYADNRSCAVSATGHGEYFIRATVARDICSRVQYSGVSLQQAAQQVVMEELVEMGGSGGIISVDREGNLSLVFNTPGMYRASVDTKGQRTVAIYR